METLNHSKANKPGLSLENTTESQKIIWHCF